MQRINQLNLAFSDQAKQVQGKAKKPKAPPIFSVADSVGLNAHLSPEVIEINKKIREYCDAHSDQLNKCADQAEFPFFIIPFLKSLNLGHIGNPKEYGGLGLSHLNYNAILMELARNDASLLTFIGVHTGLGMRSILHTGGDEIRERILSKAGNLDKICCFGLTEPKYGSAAGNLKTVAEKTEGGWILNGTKRWIGNATISDYIVVWAKNLNDDKKIQGFVVERPSQGLTTTKMEGKMALRMVQNADIKLENVFVPDKNKLEKALDFEKSLNQVLNESRLGVAWACAGVAIGAYERCLKYCLQRK
jgi:alkylation response protein AidB-like acyl-CoA dehydrogenase